MGGVLSACYDVVHTRGPLDGSLYAKINKSKSEQNRRNKEKPQKNLRVVVEGGNKVQLKSIQEKSQCIKIMDNNSNPIDVKIEQQNIDSIENGYAEIPVNDEDVAPIVVTTVTTTELVKNDYIIAEEREEEEASASLKQDADVSIVKAEVAMETTIQQSVTTAVEEELTLEEEESKVEEEETIQNKYIVDEDVNIEQEEAATEDDEVITNKYTNEETTIVKEEKEEKFSNLGSALVHENIALLAQGVESSEQEEVRYEDDFKDEIIINEKAEDMSIHDDLHNNIMQLASGVEQYENATQNESEPIVIENVYEKSEVNHREPTPADVGEKIINVSPLGSQTKVDADDAKVEEEVKEEVEQKHEEGQKEEDRVNVSIEDLQAVAKDLVDRIVDEVLKNNIENLADRREFIDSDEQNKDTTTDSNLPNAISTIQSSTTTEPKHQSPVNSTTTGNNIYIEVQAAEDQQTVEGIVETTSAEIEPEVKEEEASSTVKISEEVHEDKPPLSPPVFSQDVNDNLFEIAVKKSQHIRSISVTKENNVEDLQTVDEVTTTSNTFTESSAAAIEDNNTNKEEEGLYYDKGPEYAVPNRDFVVKSAESKKAVLVNNMNQSGPPLSPYINNEPKVPEDVQALIKGLTSGSDADSGFDGSSMNVTNGLQTSPASENDYFNKEFHKDPHEGERRYTYHSHVHKSTPIDNISAMTRTLSDPQQVNFKKVPDLPPKDPIRSTTVSHAKAEETISDVESMLEEENIKNVEDQILHTKKHLQWLEDQQVKLRKRHSLRSNEKEKKRNSSALESQSTSFLQANFSSSTLPRNNNLRSSGERPSSAVYLSPDLLQAVKQLEEVDSISQPSAPVAMVTTANHDAQNNNWTSMSKQPPPTISKPNQSITNDVNANDLTTSSADLQQQLAELDACIAQLTSSIASPPTPKNTGVVMRHKRSYSSEIDRQLDPNVPVNGASNVGLPAPTPPSRTRSSFNSVSRLSQEFDSKKIMISPTTPSPNDADEVFTPPYNHQRSKFPPQTSMTRRQQVSPEPPPKTMGSLEDRLSPDLVTAMIINPGARPKENIHSYKEDLEPSNVGESSSPVTPGFPPPTPSSAEQASSPVTTAPHRHHLVGLQATPLSTLHLKPKLPGYQNSASSPVAKETNLLSDDSRPHQLEQKLNREQESQRQQLNAPSQTQYKVKEQMIIANHSPGSQASTPYSAHSHGGSVDSLDGGNTSVSEQQTRHSNSSLLSSSSSSASSHHRHPAEMQQAGPLILSDRQMGNGGQHLSPNYDSHTPVSGRTSASSLSDIERPMSTTTHPPVFVHEAQSLWYKPDITREQALDMLRHQPAGSFVVRDSRCFPGAYGLALKVDKLPANVRPQPGVDLQNELVRHFLIEPSSRGVKLKGCPNEPVFGSLPALVYQHSITPIALPCRLLIPKLDPATPSYGTLPRQSNEIPNSATDLLRQGAACNVMYIASVETESLTGTPAIERAISDILRNPPSRIATVHFKVSPQGVTLTDNGRKIFFRRHYPTNAVTYCGLDPRGTDNRRYDTSKFGGRPNAWMFGFVARKQNSSDNVCHIFAELEEEQPARAIVNFVSKVLIRTSRT